MLNRLAMMLIEAGIVTQDDIEEITEEYGPGETELAEILVATGKVPEELVTEFMASIYSVEPIYLNEVDIPPAMAQKLPEDMARRFIIIPVEGTPHGFHVAMANPRNL